jgi:hypothetical protein
MGRVSIRPVASCSQPQPPFAGSARSAPVQCTNAAERRFVRSQVTLGSATRTAYLTPPCC